MKLFTLIFGGVGFILLAIAGLLYFRERNFLERAELVTGVVSDLDYGGSDGGYCPVIDFETKRGEPVRYFGNVCSSPPSYDIGERVEVLYDPANIRTVQMNGFWSQYVGVVVLGAIGLPFFLIGFGLPLMGRSGKT